MTGQRTGLPAVDVADVKRHNTRVVVEALKVNSQAVRFVCDVRQWLDYQRHLIDTSTDPDSVASVAGTALLNSLATLLPRSPERRAEPAGEVTPMGDEFKTGDDRDLNVGGSDSGN